ncbi:GSCFA domain-containing protein [Deinococcus multiflagellatus]|uniref:GSCFA domain-containing protein n=1 Tax=Deinococcus multiflagellatus TaxID=1656887 RepID=A0ABW1ZSY2_9DEIO|nr:GSCFA domain-containing protein [Deinococcus multiflagellatus]MBZ9716159.1 GSCFA domain-containing protein [Deinococcus multiflagellatus]
MRLQPWFTDGWETQETITSKPFNEPIRFRSVVALGSCFARNIARWLDHHGVRNHYDLWDTLYNPFAIEGEFTRLFMPLQWEEHIIEERKNGAMRYRDPWRSWITAPTREELMARNAALDDQARAALREANSIIITYGLSEVWESYGLTNLILNRVPIEADPRDIGVRWASRFATSEEVQRSTASIIDCIRQHVSADIPIIFTLSPVPLKYTSSPYSVEEATTLSKAILAVGMRDVIERAPHVHYFRSYELISRYDLQEQNVWQPDRRHVTASAIDRVAREFLRTCGYLPDEVDQFNEPHFWVPLVGLNGKVVGRSYAS